MSDAWEKKFELHCLKTSNGFVGLPNRLVNSKAFASLTTGASVKALVWFWGKVEYQRSRKKKPGAEFSIGRLDRMSNNGSISFTYREAKRRGLISKTFTRALRELHRLGFIEVACLGRGVKGEYTKFSISDRWRAYGEPGWVEFLFPNNNDRTGFRSKAFSEKIKAQKRVPDKNVRYLKDKNVR